MKKPIYFLALAAAFSGSFAVSFDSNLKWANCVQALLQRYPANSETVDGYTFEDIKALQESSTDISLRVALTTVKRSKFDFCFGKELASHEIQVLPQCRSGYEVFITEDEINRAIVFKNFTAKTKDFLFPCVKDDTDEPWTHSGRPLTKVTIHLPGFNKKVNHDLPVSPNVDKIANEKRFLPNIAIPNVVGIRVESGGGKSVYVNEEGVTTILANEDAVLRLFGSQLSAGMAFLAFLTQARIGKS